MASHMFTVNDGIQNYTFIVLTLSLTLLSRSGNWREVDRFALWLDLSKGRHPEGGGHPDSERRHRSHCGVPWPWRGLHLLHW